MNEHKVNASVIEIRQQHKAKTNSNNKLRLVFLLLRFSAPYLHLEKKEGKEGKVECKCTQYRKLNRIVWS